MPARCLLLLASLYCFARAPTALAWGPKGHAAVGAIAERRLGPEATAGLQALIGTEAHLADRALSSWPDAIRDARSETGPWHYVDIPLAQKTLDRQRDCAGGNCVVGAIERFQAALADPKAATSSKLEALSFLVHFVADLHQPLHATDHDDKGGNEVLVENAADPTDNLHRVYDEELVERAAAGRDDLAFASDLAERITLAQARAWQAGTLDSWANEAHALARAIYAELPLDAHGKPLRLDGDYRQGKLPMIEDRLQRAGVRLALLLERAFAASVSSSR